MKKILLLIASITIFNLPAMASMDSDSILLTSRQSKFFVDSSRFHTRSNGEVGFLISWAYRGVCYSTVGGGWDPSPFPGRWGGYPGRWGHPGGYTYPCNRTAGNQVVIVDNLEREGDQLIYTDKFGTRTVCADITTRRNWRGTLITTYYPSNKCVLNSKHERNQTNVYFEIR